MLMSFCWNSQTALERCLAVSVKPIWVNSVRSCSMPSAFGAVNSTNSKPSVPMGLCCSILATAFILPPDCHCCYGSARMRCGQPHDNRAQTRSQDGLRHFDTAVERSSGKLSLRQVRKAGNAPPIVRKTLHPGLPTCRCRSSRTREAVGALDLGHPRSKGGVPVGSSLFTHDAVLGMLAPGTDGLLALPVGQCDTQAITARRLHTEKAGLLRGQFQHALRRLGITGVHLGALRGEDHHVIGWLRCSGDHEAMARCASCTDCTAQAPTRPATSGGRRPSSAARSGWNKVAMKNG